MENIKVHRLHWWSLPAALFHALEAMNVDIVGRVVDVENQPVQTLDELSAPISLRCLGLEVSSFVSFGQFLAACPGLLHSKQRR